MKDIKSFVVFTEKPGPSSLFRSSEGERGSNSTLRRIGPVPVSDQLKNNFHFCNSFINNRTFKF